MLACAACAGGPLVTATEMPKDVTRHPDGVALDPPAALPDAGDRAPARGVVALREPLADDAVGDVVRAYFTAFEREDIEGLAALLTTDVVSLDPRLHGGRSALLQAWTTRMKSLDYAHTAGLENVDPDRFERHAYQDLGTPGAPARPAVMDPGDVLVRAPVTTPRVNGERYFGDVLVLVLRREGDRLKIAAVGEEDAP